MELRDEGAAPTLVTSVYGNQRDRYVKSTYSLPQEEGATVYIQEYYTVRDRMEIGIALCSMDRIESDEETLLKEMVDSVTHEYNGVALEGSKKSIATPYALPTVDPLPTFIPIESFPPVVVTPAYHPHTSHSLGLIPGGIMLGGVGIFCYVLWKIKKTAEQPTGPEQRMAELRAKRRAQDGRRTGYTAAYGAKGAAGKSYTTGRRPSPAPGKAVDKRADDRPEDVVPAELERDVHETLQRQQRQAEALGRAADRPWRRPC